jgi:processive 1,2-diacylglycerol beta-glucosyltransferase
MLPRILVLSASVGAGHMRAAQAVELALRQVAPADAVIRNVDVLTLTNAAFRKIYGSAYLDLVNKAPHVLGYIYDLMDQPRGPRSRRDRLRLLMEKLNLRKFTELLVAEPPWDVIVNTHFLPAEIIASLKRDGTLDVPQITVTTDFETHRLWVNPPCELYTTATPEGAAYLHTWGVPRGATAVSGIPIHPVFSQEKDPRECRRRQGLAEDRPVLLQLAGGFGVGPIEKLYRGLVAIEKPSLHIVVVSGKNEAVRQQLTAIDVPARHRATVMGFTDQIDELMCAADVVLTKPGGLTSSEVLARGAAMAIVNPIPGQESRNSDYLLEHGAAVKINNLATLATKLAPLLDDPQRLARLKENSKRIGKPRAAFAVAERALELAQRSRRGRA